MIKIVFLPRLRAALFAFCVIPALSACHSVDTKPVHLGDVAESAQDATIVPKVFDFGSYQEMSSVLAVDGEPVPNTPLTRKTIRVAAGPHLIRLKYELGTTFYEGDVSVELLQGHTYTVEADHKDTCHSAMWLSDGPTRLPDPPVIAVMKPKDNMAVLSALMYGCH